MGMQSTPAAPQLGELLRYWRQERGKSQLELSMDTGISQRHLSFVESGRSAPSRDWLSIVSDALNIPLRERNLLLLASGFAPQYSEQSFDAGQMAVVTRADCVSPRGSTLLLLFSDHNRRYTAVHHGAGAPRGVHVPN